METTEIRRDQIVDCRWALKRSTLIAARDVSQDIDELGIRGIVLLGHHVVQREDCESVRIVEGVTGASVVLLVEHQVDGHRKAVIVDGPFAAERVVVAPMEMELRELVDAVQGAATYLWLDLTGHLDLDWKRCKIIRQTYSAVGEFKCVHLYVHYL